jgi:hypothetical protein
MLIVTLEYTRFNEALHFTSLLSTFISLFAVPYVLPPLRCLHHTSPACYLKMLPTLDSSQLLTTLQIQTAAAAR